MTIPKTPKLTIIGLEEEQFLAAMKVSPFVIQHYQLQIQGHSSDDTGYNTDKMVDVNVQIKLRHLFFLIPYKI